MHFCLYAQLNGYKNNYACTKQAKNNVKKSGPLITENISLFWIFGQLFNYFYGLD